MFSGWRERFHHAFAFRLAWWYAIVFLVSSLALVAITYALLATTLRRHDRDFVQTMTVQFASAYARGGTEALARALQRAQATSTEGPLFVRALSRQRDLVFVSLPERWQNFDVSQLATPAPTGGEAWTTLETGEEGGAVLEVLSVELPDGTLFQVGKSTEHRALLLRGFRRMLLINLVAIVAIGIAGGIAITSSALQPLRALADTVGRIMRTGRTSARVPAQAAGDALGDLAALVNAMLDRIDTVVSGMRGALDNVAHDLRTPMTRLRSIAETGLISDDPAVLREALADCLDESDRVIAMLNTLMDISEAETGTMALALEPTDVRQLAEQTVGLYEDVADQAGVDLRQLVPADTVVPLDRNRMRQVLANLVDNAIKFTPRGGRVEMTAARDGGAVTITVSDTGIGIPPEELPRVWERLYRGDKSRSTRGLGLGLSLVKAIVEAHHGSVSISSSPEAGTRVELSLPAPANLSQM
jgi:signal transduction histidine kinase